MSLYDKASLVLIPSGTKTSKVYSQKPTNGDGDFTFSRSTAATRVNASGNIEKETQNLLLQSNSFDTTWATLNASVTGGQADKDGGTDAWLLQNTGSSGRVYQTLSASGVLTYSVYAKAGNVNWMALYVNASPYQYIFFDLANVAIGTDISGNSIDATITDEGSGWVRCSVSLNPNGNTTDFRVFPASGNGGLASSGQNIYIQDAQLEQGLVARDYIETTTTAIYGGITDNVPRLDYTDSSCPALLLEPQRTNYLPYSEYYKIWSDAGSAPVIETNYGTSPEGLQNSTRLNLVDSNDLIYRSGLGTSISGPKVFSVFAKNIANGTSQIELRIDTPSQRNTTFDLSNGTIVSSTADSSQIIDYGNGWYRCISILNDNQINNAVIQGSINLDCEIWGAQVEQGSYATSYIPTYGSAVTRNLDNTSLTGVSDLLGQTEGTIYSEVRFPQEGNASNWLSISAGNVRNWVFIGKDGDDIRGYVRANNSVIFSNQTFQIVDNALAKVAIAYKSGDIVLYINGTQISSSSTDFTFDVTLDRVYFGSYDNGNTYETRKQNQVLLFKTRLSNEELATLTTI